MNKYFLVLFVLIIGCLIMISCSDDDSSINAVNKAPKCSIITPAINSSHTIGDTIFVAVEAEDEDGSIKEIRFYFDSLGLGYDSTFPYSCDIFTNLYQKGAHFIRAVAEDNDGKEASDQIIIDLSSDQPVFDNGLMVDLVQNPLNNPDGIESVKSFTARSYVECLYQYGNTYTFSAETTSGDKWMVKFRWDGTDPDSVIYISDNSLNKIEMASAEYGNYYINSSSGNAGQTSIKVLRLVPEEIIEAKFGGYIYEQGTSSDPDTLKNGYLLTNKFVLTK